jgi:hypothetical protein
MKMTRGMFMVRRLPSGVGGLEIPARDYVANSV